MGLWDENDMEELIEYRNTYLDNPDKGIELITKLLSYDKKNKKKHKEINTLDYLLEKRLLEATGKMNIFNELDLYERLIKLSDKFYEHNKMQLLRNKSIIGIGGKFSAGKSKFINSILESEDGILPEDQTPTTSIATYIVKGKNEDIRAYTYKDQDISLDLEALDALTHKFYKEYGLGFSTFINNLVIKVPYFVYDNLALLDTPGYNKSDVGKKKNFTDAEKAYNQLKTVDYLIWIVDIENGVIHQGDIDFIEDLKIKKPVLIVFNKADKKSKNEVERIIENSKEILKDKSFPIYDVIAYSASSGTDYYDGKILLSFINEANSNIAGIENIEDEMNNIITTISKEFSKQKSETIKNRNCIGEIIYNSEDVMKIRSLVILYGESLDKLRDLNRAQRDFEQTERRIKKYLISINKR